MRPYFFAVCLLSWMVPLQAVQAQATELGLDLTEEPEAPGERFAPSLAFVGIQPVGSRQAERAKRLNIEFQKDLTEAARAGRFSHVLGPKDVLPTLKELKKTSAECRDKACLELLAETLGVDRIITGSLTPSGPSALLTLWGYEPTLPQLATETAESPEREQQQQTSGFTGLVKPSKTKIETEFSSRARGAWNKMTASMEVGLGKLIVDAVEASTQITLSGKEVGKGSFEILLERGKHSLLAEAEGFLPFSAELNIRPNKVEVLKVLLVAKPLDKPFDARVWKDPDFRKNKPIYARPGFYVALAGAAATGAGIYFGLTAKSIEKRGVDTNKNSILDITRKEAKQAQLYALLANILIGGGSAMVAGGTLWMFVAPGKVAENPLDDIGSVGVVLGIGGTF